MSFIPSLKLIGARVTEFRKNAGLTQEDLAGLCEMDRSYLSEVENGHNNMSVATLMKICVSLEVEATEILGSISDY